MKKPRVYSVAELSQVVQRTIDNQPLLGDLWVRGEIANFKKHSSGHCYFSLKDKNSNIRAVMFRSRAWKLNFLPKDGMDCLVRGYISVYPRDTMLQLYAEEIIPAGVGLDFLALEELKKKLQLKGYFAPEHKQKLPFLPKGIGVVTSPVGAALRDINKVIRRRYPGMPLILYPATVQGEKAVDPIVEGIQRLNAREDIDVIIVARGGGSVEDLYVFNSEAIADAIFTATKPVISAIGHEIDFAITDLVADVRAATPSMAGELAVPVKAELIEGLNKLQDRLSYGLANRVEKERTKLAFFAETGVMKRPERWVDNYRERLAQLEFQLFKQMDKFYQQKAQTFRVSVSKLQALSPLSTLARGYSICKNIEGSIINNSQGCEIGDKLDIQLYQGKLACVVTGKEDYHEESGKIV